MLPTLQPDRQEPGQEHQGGLRLIEGVSAADLQPTQSRIAAHGLSALASQEIHKVWQGHIPSHEHAAHPGRFLLPNRCNEPGLPRGKNGLLAGSQDHGDACAGPPGMERYRPGIDGHMGTLIILHPHGKPGSLGQDPAQGCLHTERPGGRIMGRLHVHFTRMQDQTTTLFFHEDIQGTGSVEDDAAPIRQGQPTTLAGSRALGSQLDGESAMLDGHPGHAADGKPQAQGFQGMPSAVPGIHRILRRTDQGSRQLPQGAVEDSQPCPGLTVLRRSIQPALPALAQDRIIRFTLQLQQPQGRLQGNIGPGPGPLREEGFSR